MTINRFRQTRYLLSAHHLNQLPPDTGGEVAFAGRSNAGKSSALNALTDHTRLAHTSKTPGRTQQINFFTVDSRDERLVDLPGYGYAKVPEAMREHWRGVIEAYLKQRQSLKGLILIMDVRHPLRAFDLTMLRFCSDLSLRCRCLLTKSDKLTRMQGLQALRQVERELESNHYDAKVQLFSATAKTGVDELRKILMEWLGLSTEN